MTRAPSRPAASDRVVPFLDPPPDVRRIFYTTNAIESLNSSLRTLVQRRGHFPRDDAVTTLLYLAQRNRKERWSGSAREWSKAFDQVVVLFEGRLPTN